MSNPEIAQTIRQQLGNGFFLLLGAHSLVDVGNGLQFRFRGCRVANSLVITLSPDDTYRVEMHKCGRFDSKLVRASDGVYFDRLHEVIKSWTGLETVLFPRRAV